MIATLALVIACGGGGERAVSSTTPPPARPIGPASRGTPPVEGEVIELFTALAESAAASWIGPGPLQLEPGATSFESAATLPLPVTIIERQGPNVRVAVRLDTARFGAWLDRSWLLSIIARDQRVAQFAGGGGDVIDLTAKPIEAVLRAGAYVRRIARKDGWTQIRYLGPLEVNGWVPDAVLVEQSGVRPRFGRVPTAGRLLMLTPGTVFRSKPDWGARELAILNTGSFVSTVRELDPAWVEISYSDDDVRLHAYASRRDPPGRLHRPRERESPPPLAPTATVPTGTCLHARVGGEPIGYLVGDQPVELGESGVTGWWTLTIETPWRAIAFVARGATREQLFGCAPSVPPASVP